jgi:hypothetical protein
MDISMLSKFLKVALNSLILSSICFMQSAYAGFVETPIDPVTFNWSATCYDCNIDDRGIIPNYEDWTEVTGSITLSHYKSGDAIDIENFVSFTYDGLSNHINPFTIGRGPQYSYNLLSIVGTQIDDSLFDLKIEALNDDIPPIEPEYFEILPFDASYQNAVDIARIAFWRCEINTFDPEVFCQNQTRNLNNATLNLRAHKIAINTINESFKIANDKLEEDYNNRILQDLHARMYIDLDADGTWTFQVNDEILDFGIDFNFDGLQVQHSKVSAPPAIVIFALALMGLASRRFKKQS